MKNKKQQITHGTISKKQKQQQNQTQVILDTGIIRNIIMHIMFIEKHILGQA